VGAIQVTVATHSPAVAAKGCRWERGLLWQADPTPLDSKSKSELETEYETGQQTHVNPRNY